MVKTQKYIINNNETIKLDNIIHNIIIDISKYIIDELNGTTDKELDTSKELDTLKELYNSKELDKELYNSKKLDKELYNSKELDTRKRKINIQSFVETTDSPPGLNLG